MRTFRNLEEDVRIELTEPFGPQVSNLLQYHYANLPKLVPPLGIEPSSTAYKAVASPAML